MQVAVQNGLPFTRPRVTMSDFGLECIDPVAVCQRTEDGCPMQWEDGIADAQRQDGLRVFVWLLVRYI